MITILILIIKSSVIEKNCIKYHTWTLSYSSNNGTASSFKFLGTAKYSLSDKWTRKSFLHSCIQDIQWYYRKHEPTDQGIRECKIFNDIVFANYLGLCYMRRAVWIHYGFKIWSPPDCNTLTYLQFSQDKCK